MTTIAIAGKGGTGKTTIAAAVIHWLGAHLTASILAVDADSNVNLNDVLGVDLKETIGGIREEMRALANNLPGGMTKQQFFEYKIQASLVETPHFDLLAMGRPEGPGCYCYANNLLRDILSALSDNYQYVVIDNEAGMEHLSRRTAQKIDHLLILSDPTARGIRAAGKISRLLQELEARSPEKYLVLNRVREPIPESVFKMIDEEGLKLLASIPVDEKLQKADQVGKPMWPFLPGSILYRGVDHLMAKLMNVEKGR